ncbi:hypothetical protein A3709_11630 [Halioglobus sp. HI00S01]|uniref:hypothetical protein n=1 Tax=Halioglobus sp. HI00S01 TaxID=1822214 RepID=UPI0007C2CFEC|nr:hypothetical protein [Halioglobus sp. HI00S01]KZX60447.1 hypothetical protein A3709_11630 [Halioglobus sp. HI00S01]
MAFYYQMMAALKHYRALAATGEFRPLPGETVLKPGQAYAVVPDLAARLVELGYLPAGDYGRQYGGAIKDAAKVFQADHGLDVDDIVGAQSYRFLNMTHAQRVKEPLRLAELLLDAPQQWSLEDVQAVVDSRNPQVRVPMERDVHVLLMYWTNSPARDGRLQFHADVYGKDPGALALLDAPPRVNEVRCLLLILLLLPLLARAELPTLSYRGLPLVFAPFTLVGGIARYRKTSRHGGFVHLDTRGFRARW